MPFSYQSFVPPAPILVRAPFGPKLTTATTSRNSPSANFCSISESNHPLISDRQTQRNFLQTHWNQHPLFLPNLFQAGQSPVTGNDLAALSEYHFHHARLIQHYPNDSTNPYTLTHGPFPESIWSSLPEQNWTLLIQNLERSVPAVNDLIASFSFLPNWRVDDIQASFAVRGGGVGPHVDNYDVFLVQVAGTRRWKISNTAIPPDKEDLVPDIDVRVLTDTSSLDEEYVLKAGDVMYVPPRFPHHGISMDDNCITLSVGFRAPSAAYLLSSWVEHLNESHQLNDVFYTDDTKDLVNGIQDPGRITSRAAARALDLLTKSFQAGGSDEFKAWFSREMSRRNTSDEYEDDDICYESGDEDYGIDNIINTVFRPEYEMEHLRVCQKTCSVFTYLTDESTGKCTMFIDGDDWSVEHVNVARFLCNERRRECHQYVTLSKQYRSFETLVSQLFKAKLLQLLDINSDLESENDMEGSNFENVEDGEGSELDAIHIQQT